MKVAFWNNLSVGKKLSFGFGIILLTMITLSVLTGLDMQKAAQRATSITEDQLIQLDISTKIKNATEQMMKNMVEFSYSEDPADYAASAQYVEEIRSVFDDAIRHGKKSADKTKIDNRIEDTRNRLDAYTELTAQAEEVIRKLGGNRKDLHQRGGDFIAKTLEVTAGFRGELEAEVSSDSIIQEMVTENLTRVNAMTSVLSDGQAVISETWRAQAERQFELAIEAAKGFQGILGKLEEAKNSTMDFQARQIIDEIIETTTQFQEMARLMNVNRTELSDILRQLDEEGKKMVTLANEFATDSLTAVKSNMDLTQESLNTAVRITLILTVIGAILGVIIAVITTKSITRPVSQILAVVQGLSDGDLTKAAAINQKDEIGNLARNVNDSTAKLRNVIREFLENANMLSQSAIQMSDTSSLLLEQSNDMSERSSTVAAAGEELSSNISTMSRTADELSSSAQSVASAVEEMSASLNEVAQNCAKESEIAAKANNEAESARKVMSELGTSAREISKIVEIINNIAAQTNLLALNATIEAASAGDAGKGFAVVANEVKELARQSAQATEQISRQIEQMQRSTQTSIQTIESITAIIEEVNQIAVTIAAAVEQQSVTTNEISKSLSNVSGSVNHLAINIQQSAEGANEVSENIQEVSQSAQQSAEGVNHTSMAATELTQIAERLRDLVSQFKV